MPKERPLNNAFTRIPREKLEKIISESTSIGQVFRKIGLNITGTEYKTFKRTIDRLGIDISCLKFHSLSQSKWLEKTNEQIFKQNSGVCSSVIKKRIARDNLKPYCCERCGNKGEWNDSPLVLQLDHVDGDRANNELVNLRYLCPNCHTQTPTHSQGGKRLAELKRKNQLPVCGCGNTFLGYGKMCHKCATIAASQARIGQWPNADMIRQAVWERPLTDVAKQIGRSPNGLKKFCIRKGIDLPPVGYWQRRAVGYSHEESLVSRARPIKRAKRIPPEDIEKAKKLISGGKSLRKTAKEIGCCHSTLLDRLEGDPVLSLLKHKNSKHGKNGCSSSDRTGDSRVTTERDAASPTSNENC